MRDERRRNETRTLCLHSQCTSTCACCLRVMICARVVCSCCPLNSLLFSELLLLLVHCSAFCWAPVSRGSDLIAGRHKRNSIYLLTCLGLLGINERQAVEHQILSALF